MVEYNKGNTLRSDKDIIKYILYYKDCQMISCFNCPCNLFNNTCTKSLVIKVASSLLTKDELFDLIL